MFTHSSLHIHYTLLTNTLIYYFTTQPLYITITHTLLHCIIYYLDILHFIHTQPLHYIH